MKKIFSVLIVVLFTSFNSFKADAVNIKVLGGVDCNSYATTVALLSTAYPEISYWETYFYSYNYCLENLDPIAP